MTNCNVVNCGGKCGICSPPPVQDVCPKCGYCPCCGEMRSVSIPSVWIGDTIYTPTITTDATTTDGPTWVYVNASTPWSYTQ